MKDALEVVRVGDMSINQAAIHYNLPYSSLYGRFKRGKYDETFVNQDLLQQDMTVEHYPDQAQSNINDLTQPQIASNAQVQSIPSQY